MTRLTREIEKKLAMFDQVCHRIRVANVGQLDLNSVANVDYVEKVAAVFRNQAVYQRHFRAQTHQAPRQMGTDKPDSPCYENVGSGEAVVIRRHRRIVGCDQKDFL